MSLRGRYVIDRLKAAVSHRFRLPCPPYGDPSYWDRVYKTLGPNDVFEWGDLDFDRDLVEHRYDPRRFASHVVAAGYRTLRFDVENDVGDGLVSTTAEEAFGLTPPWTRRAEVDEDEQPSTRRRRRRQRAVVLGCGNSRLGERLSDHLDDDSLLVTQVDVCGKVLEDAATRCRDRVAAGTIEFARDDATVLATFRDDDVDAVVDKGLLDALLCADDRDSARRVVESVHRVLRPGAVFSVFSLSEPDFAMMRNGEDDEHHHRRGATTRRTTGPLAPDRRLWADFQVRAMDTTILYRYVKRRARQRRRTDARRVR